MRFNILSEVGRGRKALEFNKAWHSKFAWFPFRIDDNTVIWLERYMRRKPVSSGWVYKTKWFVRVSREAFIVVAFPFRMPRISFSGQAVMHAPLLMHEFISTTGCRETGS